MECYNQKVDGTLLDSVLKLVATYVCFLLGLSADTSAYTHWPSYSCNKLRQ